MERTSLHNDSLLYASLIAILLLISYWFTTRCFKIISGIEGTGLGTWGTGWPDLAASANQVVRRARCLVRERWTGDSLSASLPSLQSLH